MEVHGRWFSSSKGWWLQVLAVSFRGSTPKAFFSGFVFEKPQSSKALNFSNPKNPSTQARPEPIGKIKPYKWPKINGFCWSYRQNPSSDWWLWAHPCTKTGQRERLLAKSQGYVPKVAQGNHGGIVESRIRPLLHRKSRGGKWENVQFGLVNFQTNHAAVFWEDEKTWHVIYIEQFGPPKLFRWTYPWSEKHFAPEKLHSTLLEAGSSSRYTTPPSFAAAITVKNPEKLEGLRRDVSPLDHPGPPGPLDQTWPIPSTCCPTFQATITSCPRHRNGENRWKNRESPRISGA